MRNLKKVLVLVLALAMMLSLMVVGAGAVFTDQSEIDSKHTEAVDMAVSLNIINGYPDGSFKPNGNVTREEMCKMICILDNGGKEPQLAPGNFFNDVALDRWSNKYIEACATRGIVAGVGNGMFNPTGNVTATQAARMLLVELGYDQNTEEYTGANWAVNVNLDATQKGYYEDLEDVDVTAPLTREHAAQMVWNALQAVEIEYDNTLVTDGNGNLSATSKAKDKTHQVAGNTVGSTLLWDKYDTADAYEGTLTMFTYDSNKAKWEYTVDDGVFTYVAKSKTDYTDLLGMNVKMVYEPGADKDAYGIFACDSSVLFSGRIADLPDLDNDATSIKFGGVTYKTDRADISQVPVYLFQYGFDVTAPVNQDPFAPFLDNWAGKTGAGANITDYDAYNFAAIDNDDDQKIDCVMVYPFAAAKITYNVGKDIRVEPTRVAVPQALVADGVINGAVTAKLEVGDDVIAYDGIAKNDYVKYIPARFTKDNTAVVTKADLFSGRVTVNDDPDFTVDGTTYTADVSYGVAPAAGSTLSDAVVINGFVFDIDATQRKEVKDYAVVISTGAGGVDGNRAKVLFADNTTQVVDTDKNYNAGAWAIPDGSLVTYKVNSDKEYKFKLAVGNIGTDPFIDSSDAGYDCYGDRTMGGTVVTEKKSNSSDNVGFVTATNDYGATTLNANVIDNTVVFVRYTQDGGATYKYKAINGAELMKTKYNTFDRAYAGFTQQYLLGTKTSKNSNNYDIDLLYLNTNNVDLSTADTYYAYVMSSVIVENKDGDNVQQLKLWTKDGEQTLLTTDTYTITNDPCGEGTIKARDVIEYKLNSDGDLSEVVNLFVAHDTVANPAPNAVNLSVGEGYGTVSITKWASTIEFQGLDAMGDKATDGTRTYVGVRGATKDYYFQTDSDTVTLYIDNGDKAGADATSIELADDSVALGWDFVTNAFVIWDDEGNLDLVVYDVNNDINP